MEDMTPSLDFEEESTGMESCMSTENVVQVAALVMNVPQVGGMRLECPVRVTCAGGEMLTTTPLDLTVTEG